MKFRGLNGIPPWERWFVVALVLVSIGFRLEYFREMAASPLSSYLRLDELFHFNWAQSIAAGNIRGDEVFFRAPVYPYLLGTLFAFFGPTLTLLRIAQHILGSLTVLLTYMLARKLFGRREAIIASLLVATYAFLFTLEDKLLFETVLIFLLMLLAVQFLQLLEHRGLGRWLVVGLLLGLVCITRPLFLPLIVVLPLLAKGALASEGRRKTLQRLAVYAGGVLVLIAPVTIRNAIVGHDFVLIASQGGLNFYIGNNPGADGTSSALPGLPGSRWERRDVEAPVRHALGRRPLASEIDWYWFRRSASFAGGQPISFLSLLSKKVALFWSRFEIPNNDNFYFLEDSSPLLSRLPAGFWLVGPLGLAGMWIAWRRHRYRSLVILLAGYAGLIALFFVCDRFRAPIVPFLCIFAGLAVTMLWDALRTRDRNGLVKNGLVLVVALAVVENNLFDFAGGNRAAELARFGDAELAAGSYDSAIATYREASAILPVQQDLYLNWGVAEWKRGNAAGAIDLFTLESARFPSSFEAAANLAHAYYLTGRIDSSGRYAEKAIALKPYASEGYLDRVFALCDSGNYAEAESTLLRFESTGAEISPYDASILAGVHLLEGKFDSAESGYRTVLGSLRANRQPGYMPEYRFSMASMLRDDERTFRAKVLYSLGNVFLAQGERDSAIFYLRMSTTDWPGFSEAWIDLAGAEAQEGDTSAAIDGFRRGLAAGSENPRGWFNYGLLLESMGRLEDAGNALTRAVEQDSGSIQARSALEELHRKMQAAGSRR